MMQDHSEGIVPTIRFLGSPGIKCEIRSCVAFAGYLFRAGNGPVAAYCETHAHKQAAQWDVTLPEPLTKALQAVR
jgi:hypothetical protein